MALNHLSPIAVHFSSVPAETLQLVGTTAASHAHKAQRHEGVRDLPNIIGQPRVSVEGQTPYIASIQAAPRARRPPVPRSLPAVLIISLPIVISVTPMGWHQSKKNSSRIADCHTIPRSSTKPGSRQSQSRGCRSAHLRRPCLVGAR